MSAGGYERMRAAMQVVHAAWKHGAPTVPVAVRALEDAQLLQSPETAAETETLRKRVAELEARPAPGDVLRSFAARIEEMREEGDPGDWLRAGTAVEEITDEAHRLAAEATRQDPTHVCEVRYCGPTAGTRCVGCHLPAEAEGGAR